MSADREAVDWALARLLGADEGVADAAVTAMRAAHAGTEGQEAASGDGPDVLFMAVMASARWGTDVAGALRRMAEGQEPPVSWSAYEERTAREEAQEEAQEALARLDATGLPDGVAPELAEAVRRVLTPVAQGGHPEEKSS